MQIILSPQRRETRLTLARHGDILTINGANFDFCPLQESPRLPASAVQSNWLAGDVTRQGGQLIIPLFLPHGAMAPHETLFPAPLEITGNGDIALPPYEIEVTP